MLQTFSGGAVVFRDRAKLLKGLLRGGMACLAPTVGNPQVTTKAVATCVPTLDSSPGRRPRTGPQEALMQLKRVKIHGHEIGYYAAGSGPALVLLHGVASSSRTWRQVLPRLSERFTVAAPGPLG